MIFNFKKVASVIASAVMLTSTIGFAAASTYPAPFSSGAAVVYGSTALSTDMAAAISIYDGLKGSTSAGTAASVSGGDGVELATSSQNLYYNSTLNSAKTSITDSELPTILKDGSVIDDIGTTYTYTQSIRLGTSKIAYGTSGGDLTDPDLYIDVGSDVSVPVYNFTITFNKNINLSNANVQGNDMEVFGNKFTIGANSVSATAGSEVLELFGTGESLTMNEGEEQTITVGGTSHTIKLSGIDSAGKASISIDGGTIRQIASGTSSKVSGLEVYVKTTFYSAKESSTNYATLNVGSNKLKLQQGQTVYQGSDDTAVQNTKVTITATGGLVSGVLISYAMQSGTKDYLKIGDSFTDPIFAGLKLSFASAEPGLADSAREKFVVDTDNNRAVRVTATTELVGEEKQFTFLHDDDTSESTITPVLTDLSNKTIHVKEGESAKINEYYVINSGDYGRIVKITSLPSGALQSTSTIQLEDALTGKCLFTGSDGSCSGLTVGATGNATTNIDGQPYYFGAYNGTSTTGTTPSTLTITWGAGSTYLTVGTQTTLFPRIKLKNGAWFAILTKTNITSAATYSLPGSDTLSTYETGDTIAGSITDGGRSFQKIGNVNWSFASNTTGGLTSYIDGINTDSDNDVECFFNMNATYGAAILYQEEKKTTESGNSNNGDIICIGTDASGTTTPVEVSVAQPVVTGVWSSLQSWQSDSYQQSAVDRYGTYIKYNSQDNDKTEIYYPNEQMIADVLFAAEGATVTPGTTGSTGSTGTIRIVTDLDVASVSDKNLIAIGGSCINQVAAKILGSDSPLCEDAFTNVAKVSAGGYIIKTVKSPYNDAKVAMLVAGYNAIDTQNAVKAVTTATKTDVGSEEIFPVVATTTG